LIGLTGLEQAADLLLAFSVLLFVCSVLYRLYRLATTRVRVKAGRASA